MCHGGSWNLVHNDCIQSLIFDLGWFFYKSFLWLKKNDWQDSLVVALTKLVFGSGINRSLHRSISQVFLNGYVILDKCVVLHKMTKNFHLFYDCIVDCNFSFDTINTFFYLMTVKSNLKKKESYIFGTVFPFFLIILSFFSNGEYFGLHFRIAHSIIKKIKYRMSR